MTYDAVIVGASLAGLYSGMALARKGWKVCILDRKSTIGIPVRCGEATGNRRELARFVPIDESWIASTITGVALHLNDALLVRHHLRDCGVVLHRDKFEQELARRAESYGARIRLNAPVVKLLPGPQAGYEGIGLDSGEVIAGRYVIGADGPESKIGQWAKITKPLALHEAASTMEYRVQTDYCNDGLIHLFIGSKAAPGGYAWVFRKSATEVSVGAGIIGGLTKQIKVADLLHSFIDRNMPGVQKHTMITGCVPVTIAPKNLSRHNVLVIGDAARQTNPLSAGGIMNTLEASDLAVRQLLNNKNRTDLDRAGQAYSRGWARTQRWQQKIFYMLRDIYFDASDEELVRVSKTLAALLKSADRNKPFKISPLAGLRLLAAIVPKVFKQRSQLVAILKS